MGSTLTGSWYSTGTVGHIRATCETTRYSPFRTKQRQRSAACGGFQKQIECHHGTGAGRLAEAPTHAASTNRRVTTSEPLQCNAQANHTGVGWFWIRLQADGNSVTGSKLPRAKRNVSKSCLTMTTLRSWEIYAKLKALPKQTLYVVL